MGKKEKKSRKRRSSHVVYTRPRYYRSRRTLNRGPTGRSDILVHQSPREGLWLQGKGLAGLTGRLGHATVQASRRGATRPPSVQPCSRRSFFFSSEEVKTKSCTKTFTE